MSKVGHEDTTQTNENSSNVHPGIFISTCFMFLCLFSVCEFRPPPALEVHNCLVWPPSPHSHPAPQAWWVQKIPHHAPPSALSLKYKSVKSVVIYYRKEIFSKTKIYSLRSCIVCTIHIHQTLHINLYH